MKHQFQLTPKWLCTQTQKKDCRGTLADGVETFESSFCSELGDVVWKVLCLEISCNVQSRADLHEKAFLKTSVDCYRCAS